MSKAREDYRENSITVPMTGELKDKVICASKKLSIPMSAYARIALIEKLEREN